MGYEYDEYYCGDFTGKQIDELLHKIERAKIFDAQNCPNCGAPMNKYGGCDYCGTGRQSEPEKPPQTEKRIEWDYHGMPLHDNEALVMFMGELHRCYVANAESCELNGAHAGRDRFGNLVRDTLGRKFIFRVIEN